MKNVFILLFTLGCITSCSKTYTCNCTETYDGDYDAYSKNTTEVYEDLKKDEAEKKCSEGNFGPQTIYNETYTISCELN
jgi:hypothetical protein